MVMKNGEKDKAKPVLNHVPAMEQERMVCHDQERMVKRMVKKTRLGQPWTSPGARKNGEKERMVHHDQERMVMKNGEKDKAKPVWKGHQYGSERNRSVK